MTWRKIEFVEKTLDAFVGGVGCFGGLFRRFVDGVYVGRKRKFLTRRLPPGPFHLNYLRIESGLVENIQILMLFQDKMIHAVDPSAVPFLGKRRRFSEKLYKGGAQVGW